MQSKARRLISSGLVILALIILIIAGILSFWNALAPSFEAIRFLESKGYTHVRILYIVPEGRGCQESDLYRWVFDAVPPGEKERAEGNVCKNSAGFWYEDK